MNGRGTTHKNYQPNGPATLTAHKGFNGCTMYAIAFTHSGIGAFEAGSTGLSGKPHGSARIRCLILSGYCIVYEAARKPPIEWPSSTNFSNCISLLHSSMERTSWSSASFASLLKAGRLLRPNPKLRQM